MGLRRMTSNLFTHMNLHLTNHKLVSTMLEHLWYSDKPRTTSNSQDSPRPRLGGSRHLPPYNIHCTSLQGPNPKGLVVSGFPKGSPEIAKVGTPTTLWGYNFVLKPLIEMRSKAKLQLSSKAFQRRVARHLHAWKSGRFPTSYGWESKCQFDSWPLFLP
jgi:hypothetical protein